jgi:hypothetical protein
MTLGIPSATYDRNDQAKLRRDLDAALAKCLQQGVAIPYLLMKATDDASTVKMTVDSAGVWTGVLVAR